MKVQDGVFTTLTARVIKHRGFCWRKKAVVALTRIVSVTGCFERAAKGMLIRGRHVMCRFY